MDMLTTYAQTMPTYGVFFFFFIENSKSGFSLPFRSQTRMSVEGSLWLKLIRLHLAGV